MTEQAVSANSSLYSAEAKVHGRRFSSRLLRGGLAGDITVVFLGLALSSWLRFQTGLADYGRGAEAIFWRDYLGRAAFGTFLFIALLPHRVFYEVGSILDLPKTVRLIVRTALRWLVAYIALTWLLRLGTDISRIYIALGFVVTTSLFVVWRIFFHRLAERWAEDHRLRRRVLFVGWTPQAAALARAIEHDPHRPYEVAGHVDPGDVGTALQERAIDTVILADGELTSEQTLPLANLCEKEMVEFKVIPSCFQILLSCLRLQSVCGVPMLGIDRLPMDSPFSALFKRATDVGGAIVGLLLSSPLVLFFCALVYLENPGPVIYRQRRTGRDGRPFWILKIRSMKMDAEASGRAGWTVRDDPRRLRIGGFMRRWNIDELPQFWNVLRGEMSLVGPRPERPELIRNFREQIAHYNARHSMKPGMTGWAQVNGFRGDTDLNERIRCDLYYIENWSLLLDLQIMVMTLFCYKNAG